MGAFFNQYSFILLAVLLGVLSGIILLTRKPRWNDYLAFGALLVGLVLTWSMLHPRQTPLMDDSEKVRAMIGAGTPVLLEFQSPYCLACTAIKPSVDELESELSGRLQVIRLNVQDSVGRELAAVYGFTFTPTFILFDAQGNELWRQVGRLDSDRVRVSLP